MPHESLPVLTSSSPGPRARNPKKGLRVGVVDVIYDSGGSPRPFDYVESRLVFKQYAAIMPQAISVWCKNLGCEVIYKTYYSQCDLLTIVPDDLDFLFVACCTQEAHLAYALSRKHQQNGTVTVLGGAHAHCFPHDSLRFFDVVVDQCNQDLLKAILSDPPRGEHVSSAAPTVFPSLEERIDEVKEAYFFNGRPAPSSTVALHASVGCPYTCGFCVDYNSEYRTIDTETFERDIRYLNTHYPNVLIAFHDANFAVRFDETLSCLERMENKNGYGIGITMSVLGRKGRVERLLDTGCRYIQCGIESLSGYHDKQGRKRAMALHDNRMLAQEFFNDMAKQFDCTQANIILGLDEDSGTDIVDEYEAFIQESSAGIINLCNPTPFAQTPLYDELKSQDRILPMPFLFYRDSYLAIQPKNYEAPDYYRHLVRLADASTSPRAIYNQLAPPSLGGLRRRPLPRTWGMLVMRLVDRYQYGPKCKEILAAFDETDMRDFYAGKTKTLPNYLRKEFVDRASRFQDLVALSELEHPVFEDSGTAHRGADRRSQTATVSINQPGL